MKIDKKPSKKPLAIVVVLLVVVLSGLLFTYVYAFNGSIFGWSKAPSDNTQTKSKSSKTTKEQSKNAEQIKEGSVTADDTKPGTGSGSSTTDESTSTTNVTITASAQNGSTFQIRTLIDTVTSSGTCTLTLTKGSATVTKTSDVQPTADSSTCKGFDVPVAELSPGSWNATISFENNQLKGSATKLVQIN